MVTQTFHPAIDLRILSFFIGRLFSTEYDLNPASEARLN
jgi:hypothetical protein